MPSAIVKAAYMRVSQSPTAERWKHRLIQTKLSPTTWKIKTLLSSETTHLALHQLLLGTSHQGKHGHQVLAVQTRVPRRAHTGGLHCYPDLNNYEHASQWGQDWNAGDADTSGSSDVELYGLQKGEGAKGNGGSFIVICYNCGKSGHSAMQRVEKQKEKDRERRETAKVGMTAKVGQSERDGQTVKVGTLQAKVGSNKGQQE